MIGSNTIDDHHAQEIEDTNQSSALHTPLPIIPEARELLSHLSVQSLSHFYQS